MAPVGGQWATSERMTSLSSTIGASRRRSPREGRNGALCGATSAQPVVAAVWARRVVHVPRREEDQLEQQQEQREQRREQRAAPEPEAEAAAVW